MTESEILLDYNGLIDFTVMDSLLVKLKDLREFTLLNTVTRKRVYSMVVECLDNIYRHAELKLSDDPEMHSRINVRNENDKIVIVGANPVREDSKDNIVRRLDLLNKSDEPALRTLYKNKISSNLRNNEKCAGLGFIHMALKSGNQIVYNFYPITDGYLNFEIQITLNK